VAWRVRADENKDTPLPPETPQGKNPPAGAIIDYHLARAANGAVTLSIYDHDGHLVRRYSSQDKPAHLDAFRYFPKGWLRPGAPLSAAAGPHRFVWDLRYSRPQAIKYGYSIAATWDSDTPVTPEGPLVLPGTYRVVLRVDGKAYRAPLTVRADPREHVSSAALAAALDFSRQLGLSLQRIHGTYTQVHAVREQLDALRGKLAGDPARQGLLDAVGQLEKATAPLVSGSNHEGTRNLRGMSDVLAGIAQDVTGADRAPTDGQRAVLAMYRRDYTAAARTWSRLRRTQLTHLNARLHQVGLARVAVPAADPSAMQHAREDHGRP
jgi:hypothetical protein